MDKRVLKTRESIKTAFMQLTLESELEKITVSEIAEKAKINRSTFYLHYGDVSSVIGDIEKEFADEINVCIDDFDISDVYGSIYKTFTYLTDALERDELIKRYIIYSADSKNVTNRLKLHFVERASAALSEAYPDIVGETAVYSLTYAVAGIIESYVRWVKDADTTSVTLEELIRKVSAYTVNVISDITAKK